MSETETKESESNSLATSGTPNSRHTMEEKRKMRNIIALTAIFTRRPFSIHTKRHARAVDNQWNAQIQIQMYRDVGVIMCFLPRIDPGGSTWNVYGIYKEVSVAGCYSFTHVVCGYHFSTSCVAIFMSLLRSLVSNGKQNGGPCSYRSMRCECICQCQLTLSPRLVLFVSIIAVVFGNNECFPPCRSCSDDGGGDGDCVCQKLCEGRLTVKPLEQFVLVVG